MTKQDHYKNNNVPYEFTKHKHWTIPHNNVLVNKYTKSNLLYFIKSDSTTIDDQTKPVEHRFMFFNLVTPKSQVWAFIPHIEKGRSRQSESLWTSTLKHQYTSTLWNDLQKWEMSVQVSELL